MRIILTLDESLTVGAHIEEVPSPNQPQCLALRDLAILAGQLRGSLLYKEESETVTGPTPDDLPAAIRRNLEQVQEILGPFGLLIDTSPILRPPGGGETPKPKHLRPPGEALCANCATTTEEIAALTGPNVILDAAGLDDLPTRTLIVDREGQAWQKRVWSWGTSKPRWLAPGSDIPADDDEVFLPVTVVWRPAKP